MARTDNFRQQHAEMLKITGDLSALMKADQLAQDASGACKLLATLAGKIQMHLAVEDQSLYPSLLGHKDAGVRTIAKQFNDEMGGLLNVFGQYRKKWMIPASIQSQPDEFIKESQSVFGALSKRIDKENRELYTLVDKL